MVEWTRGRSVAALFALGFALTLALGFSGRFPFNPRTFFYDYYAFSCAGAIAGTRDDPYRAEPLRSCEHRQAPALRLRKDLAALAIPAPLPGYALAPFAIVGRLPTGLGITLWLIVSILAGVVAGRALQRMSRLPPETVWIAIALPLLGAILLGQIVAVAFGALCLAALALERGRYAVVAGALWCAMIEPHVALPAVVAAAIFVPRARIGLAMGTVVAIGISLGLLGLGVNLEYLANVLPAHAASEIGNEEQYSLTYLLHGLGVSGPLALGLADLWYVAMLAASLWLANRLVRRGAPRSLYVLLPAAFAVVGGPFVHLGQIAFALPATLVLAGRVTPRAGAVSLAIVLLAIPWGSFASVIILPLVVVVTGALIAERFRVRAIVATVAGLAAAVFFAELTLHLVARPDATAALAPFWNGRLLAESSWAAYIRNGYHANALLYNVAKIPTLIGLGLMIAMTVRAALRSGLSPRTRLEAA